MGYLAGAFTVSFIIQLAMCLIEMKAIRKLVPLIIKGSVFLCLIVFSLGPTANNPDTDTRIMLAFYAFVTLVGLAGIGLAWVLYAVKKRLYDF